MLVEKNVALQPYNTFGIVAKALELVRVRSAQDAHEWAAQGEARVRSCFVLGGGSNIVLTGDVRSTVLKVEIDGIRQVGESARHWIVAAGGGVSWHELVCWTLDHAMPGLENMALIPGTVGASPVQNIGAYGVELQDRFDGLDAIDLETGENMRMAAADCGFGYRDSVFKHGLAGKTLITEVRLAIPKSWRPVLGYADLERKQLETGIRDPDPRQIFDWVCDIRRSKLPDPSVAGNAGSFFKNPSVTPDQCADIIAREPRIVHYPMADGSIKLAAGWLIDACGWKGKSVGNAGVYEKQALVLVNRGGATGGEVVTLARAIQTSVYERFGIRLEPEPVVV